MAVEERSSSYQDLVSNNNALLAVMRRKGLWKTYAGRAFARRCRSASRSPSGTRLRPAAQPRDRFVQRRLLRPEDGRGADHPVDAGNPQQRGRQPADGCLRQLHGGGRALARRHHGRRPVLATAPPTAASRSPASPTAIPIITTTGVYGGIDRATATIWRTTTYDAHTGGVPPRSARRSTRPPSARCSTAS